jgi:hypothetical protein
MSEGESNKHLIITNPRDSLSPWSIAGSSHKAVEQEARNADSGHRSHRPHLLLRSGSSNRVQSHDSFANEDKKINEGEIHEISKE